MLASFGDVFWGVPDECFSFPPWLSKGGRLSVPRLQGSRWLCQQENHLDLQPTISMRSLETAPCECSLRSIHKITALATGIVGGVPAHDREWNEMGFKVPPNPNYSGVLGFYEIASCILCTKGFLHSPGAWGSPTSRKEIDWHWKEGNKQFSLLVMHGGIFNRL